MLPESFQSARQQGAHCCLSNPHVVGPVLVAWEAVSSQHGDQDHPDPHIAGRVVPAAGTATSQQGGVVSCQLGASQPGGVVSWERDPCQARMLLCSHVGIGSDPILMWLSLLGRVTFPSHAEIGALMIPMWLSLTGTIHPGTRGDQDPPDPHEAANSVPMGKPLLAMWRLDLIPKWLRCSSPPAPCHLPAPYWHLAQLNPVSIGYSFASLPTGLCPLGV